MSEADGPRLADEVLAAIGAVTRDGDEVEIESGEDDRTPRTGARLDGERDGRPRDPVTQEYES